jgi:acetyl-CoA carboxylase carboxyl transferase subunit alpha
MHFLEFEKPIQELHEELQRLKGIHAKGKTDLSTAIKELEDQLIAERNALYGKLSGWQRVQVSRHPDRPYTLFSLKTPAPTSWKFMGIDHFATTKPL